MANPEHVRVARGGALAILKWKEGRKDARLNLSGAKLTQLNLERADLSEADLRRANLEGSRLNHANLYLAKASDANMRHADLRVAQIRGANFDGCDLTGARLIGTTLRTVRLKGASLTGAVFGGTIMSALDLSATLGLDNTRHDRPSSIGIDTIVASRGRIPPEFLRAAGTPESLVKFVMGLARDALGFYSCFISYTEKDHKLSSRLYRDLEKLGVRCWRWREDSRWGRPLQDNIDAALREHEKLIVILSEHSLQAKPVLYEIEKTIARENQSKRSVLFPIRVDDAIFAWKSEFKDDLLKAHVGDFSRWKKKTGYDAALKRLLRDLRAEKRADNEAAEPWGRPKISMI